MSMERGTGGTRFIDADAEIPALMQAIREGLHKLAEYDPERPLDLAAVTITTARIPNGKISVEVARDLFARKVATSMSYPSEDWATWQEASTCRRCNEAITRLGNLWYHANGLLMCEGEK